MGSQALHCLANVTATKMHLRMNEANIAPRVALIKEGVKV